MTDRLEELMDQVEEIDAAEAEMELFFRTLPGGWTEGSVNQDRRQDGTTQTTGQGEALLEERTGGAAFAEEQGILGRTVPENGGEETIWALNGSRADGENGAAEAGAAFEREQLIFGRTAPENGGEETIRALNGSRADGGNGAAETGAALSADVLWGEKRRQTAEAELYQRLTRAGWERSGSRPVERSVVVERQSVGTPSLTVDQLDRAVRRDSRRYDGGMELY